MSTPVEPGKQTLVTHTSERTIGQLVSDVSTDLSQIVRGEMELAKTELMASAQHAGKGAGMLVGAAVVALYGLGLLFLGLAAVIAIWLPWWAGILIMAGVLFLVAGILALIGRKQVKQVNPKPEAAIEHAQETVEALRTAPAKFKGGEAARPVAALETADKQG
ncbi:phage holin family protein [Ornithinimicrobium sp. Y1847]|uniref:phage holin family protein n=1 Tax=Ornithinimicrobium sp. Y1847 TaxID=3405419 RepID=UPI003B66C455